MTAFMLQAPTPLRFRKICTGLLVVACALLGGWLPSAHAQLDVPLSSTGKSSAKFPITIADFSGVHGKEIAQIIADDLTRSGQFDVKRVESVSTDSSGHANWDAIKALGVTSPIAFGSTADGSVNYHLADPMQQAEIESKSVSDANLRRQAHRVADSIYQSQTGVRGIFSTRIAFAAGHRLVVADADGQNQQTVASSNASIISPAWSPDGSRLAYVSFELGKPVVYIQNLSTGARTVVANFKGNNSAPAWSPDGSRLAVALSRNALSNIYLMSSSGGNPTQITNSSEIDTEPYFFPNGSGIVFTSDRGGRAQIYRTGLGGGDASRITYNGVQNVSGKISPDGTKLVYSSLRGSAYSIAIMNLGGGSDQLLTSGPNDLSPSFAANGMQILYVSDGNLSIVNADGSFQTPLISVGGVSSAAWGPFID